MSKNVFVAQSGGPSAVINNSIRGVIDAIQADETHLGTRREDTMPEFGRLSRTVIIAFHAIVGWAFCGAIVAIGRQFFSMQTTLVIHAIGAPIGYVLLSLLYFSKFGFTSPLQTAALFLSVVVGLDLLLIAPVLEKSFAMFASVLGTWIPFLLIFAATYATGVLMGKRKSVGTDTSG